MNNAAGDGSVGLRGRGGGAKLARTAMSFFILLGLAFGGFLPAEAFFPGGSLQEGPGAAARFVEVETLPGEFVPGEILVKLRSGVSSDAGQTVMERYAATYQETVYGSAVQVWRVSEGRELETIEQLAGDPHVEYAEPNYIYRVFVEPNDPHFNHQWAHVKVGSEAAWDITTGSASVTIAIIDTGIDENHPDLKAKLVPGKDFVDGDLNPHDLNGHGTHVAGIAAAATNNAVGVAGMSWGARIMPLRVLRGDGTGSSDDILSAINWAVNHDAQVINFSLGGDSYLQSMQDAVNAAHATGVLIVAAMGNFRDTGNPTIYPAAYDNVMAVAATGPTDQYAYYSQYGPHVDIAAPGGDFAFGSSQGIYSTMPTYPVYLTNNYGYNLNYDYLQGTSQATPLVAGLAALIWSQDPSLTPDQVQIRIENSAVDLPPAGWDQNYGWGRIDAYRALADYAVPAAPNLFTISNPDGDGDYLVDWSEVPEASSYTLQEDDSQAFSSPEIVYAGPASQYQVSGNGPGRWYYRVRASNQVGNSDWSNVRAAGVLPGAPQLNPIQNPTQEDAYQISWSSVLGADGYTLQEDDNPSFSSPLVRYDGAATMYDVSGQDGGTWYYRVRAHNQVGGGPWSTQVQSTTVMTPALGKPNLKPIDNLDHRGDYTVTWTQVVSATSYALEESVDPYFSKPRLVYSGSLTQTNILDQPGGSWYYRVRAFGPLGKGPWSGSQSTVVYALVYLPVVARNYPGISGFDSQFNNSAEGWETPSGVWSLVNGAYRSAGSTNDLIRVDWASLKTLQGTADIKPEPLESFQASGGDLATQHGTLYGYTE